MWLQVPVERKDRRRGTQCTINVSSKKLPLLEATIFKTTNLFSTAFGGVRGAAHAALQGNRGMYIHSGSLVAFPTPMSFYSAKRPTEQSKVRGTTVLQMVPRIWADLCLCALRSEPRVQGALWNRE